jgi:hypothetical protein
MALYGNPPRGGEALEGGLGVWAAAETAANRRRAGRHWLGNVAMAAPGWRRRHRAVSGIGHPAGEKTVNLDREAHDNKYRLQAS